MISGRATPEATAAFAAQHANLQFRILGNTELSVSQAGFGSYRVDPQIHNHHIALRQAVQSGINLIDTSSNYGGGGSEQLIGYLLGTLIAGGQVTREQVVIVSKGGYLQGDNYEESQKRKADNNPWPELVEYGYELEHCIHPEFLADQITRSLERLNMDTIDVYLLHNPEYYLGWAAKKLVPLEPIREEYYRRLQVAFDHLEGEVLSGRIGAYGISSNTFVASPDDGQFTDLGRINEILSGISENHNFRVVQFPLNVIETEGAAISNHGDKTMVEIATESEHAILINRPLNAVVGHQLTRLADPPDTGEATDADVDTQLDTLLSLEREFVEQISPELKMEYKVKAQLQQYLAVGNVLAGKWHGLGSYHQWQQTLTSYLLPRLNSAVKFLGQPDNMPAGYEGWLIEYGEAVNRAIWSINAVYGTSAKATAATLRQTIVEAEPSWEADTLSQSALRALRSTEGITSVLVGMRAPDYVSDVVAELQHPIEQKPHKLAWKKLAETA